MGTYQCKKWCVSCEDLMFHKWAIILIIDTRNVEDTLSAILNEVENAIELVIDISYIEISARIDANLANSSDKLEFSAKVKGLYILNNNCQTSHA